MMVQCSSEGLSGSLLPAYRSLSSPLPRWPWAWPWYALWPMRWYIPSMTEADTWKVLVHWAWSLLVTEDPHTAVSEQARVATRRWETTEGQHSQPGQPSQAGDRGHPGPLIPCWTCLEQKSHQLISRCMRNNTWLLFQATVLWVCYRAKGNQLNAIPPKL